MKKARKGFTLVELLIVIGIIGILGAMVMIGGQEATDAAKATNILDNMEKASAAMMAYYADNSDTIDKSGTDAKKVATGASAYLKSGVLVETAASTTVSDTGVYTVILTADDDATAKWWIAYKLAKTDGNVGKVLANRATRFQFKDAAADVVVVDDPETTDVDESLNSTQIGAYTAEKDTVFMLVR